MDLFENDTDLLLMELERRDGIYSFIFHDLEENTLQKDSEEAKCNVADQIEESIGSFKDFLHEQQTKTSNTAPQIAKSPLLSSTSLAASSKNSYMFGDGCVNRSSNDLGNSRQTNFNFQLPMTTANFGFQQFCSLHTYNLRRPKTSFQHLHAPLVRNRRHQLKEAKEYKNFMNNIKQVADLRELFPLDPDVHAPFQKGREKRFINPQYP